MIVVLYLLTLVAELLFIARIVYINKDKNKRKKLLAKHKAKHGELAFGVYSKLYTPRFLHATVIVSLGWILLITSNILRWNQNYNSVMSLAVGGIGIVVLIVGCSMQSAILKENG